MINADEILTKYEDEIVENYLDLFTFNYEEFIFKYNELNKKYSNNYLKAVDQDMNLLEEFYSL